MNIRESTVSTRHGALAYSRSGHGPKLVLLPANGHDARDFAAVRASLSSRFETVAFDWPSMGATPALSDPMQSSAAVFAEMLEDAVDALGLSGAVFMGHSVGGFAAARLAARRPAKVRALVLMSAGGFVPVDAAGAVFCRIKGTALATRFGEGAFARWHAKTRNPHVDQMIARIDEARRRPAYAVTVAAVWRSFARPEHDLRAEARSIRCPTLLVWGGLDPVLPVRVAGHAAALAIPQARLSVLPTGHSPFVEAPEAFLAEVDPFLNGLPGELQPTPTRGAAEA
jgi:pimeloyl-ACP methyl ester carboxylesterase